MGFQKMPGERITEIRYLPWKGEGDLPPRILFPADGAFVLVLSYICMSANAAGEARGGDSRCRR
jgi:hypothetical protein